MSATEFDPYNILISGDTFPHFFKNHFRSMQKCERRLVKSKVFLIINVSSDSPTQPHHQELYDELEIECIDNPIDDDPEKPLTKAFKAHCILYADKIKRHLKSNPNDKVLIHCSAGINRSAAAAAIIIWLLRKKSTAHLNNVWKTPEEMIEWMRQCQKRDRKHHILLRNETFYQNVIEFCYQQSYC